MRNRSIAQNTKMRSGSVAQITKMRNGLRIDTFQGGRAHNFFFFSSFLPRILDSFMHRCQSYESKQVKCIKKLLFQVPLVPLSLTTYTHTRRGLCFSSPYYQFLIRCTKYKYTQQIRCAKYKNAQWFRCAKYKNTQRIKN